MSVSNGLLLFGPDELTWTEQLLAAVVGQRCCHPFVHAADQLCNTLFMDRTLRR
jgi:hypothetical protein